MRDGLLPGEFSVTLDMDDVRIGVVGLNTTFLQLAGGDFQGKLAWDVRQFHAACTGDAHGDGPGWVRDHDLCLLMTHQGPDWLDQHSRVDVYPEINPAGRFAVHLFGHMHENVVRGSSIGGGEMLWLWQGNSLFSLEIFGDPPRDDRRHGYSAGTIELEGTSAYLRHWPRKAVKDANGWRFERDAQSCVLDENDGGTKPRVNGVQPRSRGLAKSRAGAMKTGPTLSIGERTALEVYIRAARCLWDIIDLAGLPEDDRHLAMQRFLLRQLFVPLRLTVEAPAQEAWSDQAVEQLEERRRQRRLSEAGRGARDGSAWPDELKERGHRFSIGQRLSPVDIQEVAAPASSPVSRLVVLSDPGGGKTTLLRWLATAYLMRLTRDPDFAKLPDVTSLPDKDWLPVLVRCRDLDKSRMASQQLTIEDVLQQSLSKMQLGAAQVDPLVALLRKMLEQGEVLLLLDGLDEITDPQLRFQFCGWIETVAERFPTPLVVTSRIVGYREMKRRLRGGFEHLTLADLAADDKDEFVRRWCEVTIAESPRRQAEMEKLTQAIHGRQSDRIERLTGNPMLLTTLALVQRKVGKLPSKRHKLYWEAVGVLLNWRADVDEPLDTDEALPQLQYVAYAMCDRGVQRLRRDELLTLLEGVRRDYPHIRLVQRQTPEGFVAQLERRTGLLVETGYEQHDGRPVPVYEFRHLTFQEYLAALALVEGRFPGHKTQSTLAQRVAPLAGKLADVRGRLDEAEPQVTENWREALRLCVASCNDDDVNTTLLAILTGRTAPLDGPQDASALKPPQEPGRGTETRLDRPADEREARPRAILAALCLADEPNVSESTAQAVLGSFATQVGDQDGRGRDVISSLDQATIELAYSVWCAPLQSALIREYQSRSPDSRWNPGALCGMVSAAALPEDQSAREAWLRNQVTQLRSSDLDAALIAAVGVMEVAYEGKVRFVVGLIDGLTALIPRSPAAALAASWALWWLSSKEDSAGQRAWTPTADEFARLAPFLRDTTTDGEAVHFLCDVAKAVKSPETVPALLIALTHPWPRARFRAVTALGAIKDPGAVPALLDCLKDGDADVRRAAADALGAIEDPGAVPALLDYLNDGDADVRRAAADALGAIEDPGAVPALLDCLKDGDADVRRAAADALGAIKDPGAVPALLDCLKDGDADVRRAAADALGAIKDPGTVPALLDCLKDGDADVRRAAADALGAIEDPGAVPALLDCLKDGDADVRRAAADALGAIKDPGTVPALLDRLKDGDADVRRAAADALGAIKDPGAVPALLDYLKDGDADVRRAAAAALGAIEDPGAVPALLDCLKDGDAAVRRAAVGALAMREGNEIRRMLSRDVDGIGPWLDPQVPIDAARVADVTRETNLSKTDVHRLYEEIASGFGLTLQWKRGDERRKA